MSEGEREKETEPNQCIILFLRGHNELVCNCCYYGSLDKLTIGTKVWNVDLLFANTSQILLLH